MGSSNSKEKELNEDLERIRKERIARERDERERDERELAEKDRVANSKLIRIKIGDYEIEIHELENVLALLEKFALLLGLNRSAARSMQLEFSENILAHELQLEPAGLCDESLCSVLNVDLVLKANAVVISDAAYYNQVAEVRLVCQYAPEKVNDRNLDGETALHWAAISNSLEVAQLILGAGASVDAKDNDGYTALHRAASNNSLEVAELLVGAEASVDAKTNFGKTPLQIAERQSHRQMVALLSRQ